MSPMRVLDAAIDALPEHERRRTNKPALRRVLSNAITFVEEQNTFPAGTARSNSRFSEAYRYIVRLAAVRSGRPIVAGSRIAVHDVIGLLQNGETVDTLAANCFPGLTRSQIYECLAYYEDHRGEIDLLVARQMAPASE